MRPLPPPGRCLCPHGPWGCQNMAAPGNAGLCVECNRQITPNHIHGGVHPVTGAVQPMVPLCEVTCNCRCWGCDGEDPDGEDVALGGSSSSEGTWPEGEEETPRGMTRDVWRAAWMLADDLGLHHRLRVFREDTFPPHRPRNAPRDIWLTDSRSLEVLRTFLLYAWGTVYGEEAVVPPQLGADIASAWLRPCYRMLRARGFTDLQIYHGHASVGLDESVTPALDDTL